MVTKAVWTCLCLSAVLMTGSAYAQPAQGKANPVVIISTSVGDITAELYADKAPISVENFLAYAKEGFYNGTIFHRVIKGFMVQGGGLTADGRPKPTKPAIRNEAGNGLKNQRGTLAMARTGEVNSATSQFFINTVNNGFLDHQSNDPAKFGYAIFGKVTAGMDVVDKIEKAPTKAGDFPVEPVVIKSVTVK